MPAIILFQSIPDKNFSWILYILFGLFLLAVIVGAFASRKKKEPAPPSDQEPMESIKKTSPASSRKKANK